MIEPNWRPNDRQLRQFAVVSLIGFGVVGAVLRWRFGLETVPLVLWALGAVTCVAGLIVPRSITPIYLALLAISVPIGFVLSNLLLRILYYGVFTPIAVFFRLIGRDALRMKKPQTATYWLDRGPPRDRESYFRQT